jgi:hypothetical protein
MDNQHTGPCLTYSPKIIFLSDITQLIPLSSKSGHAVYTGMWNGTKIFYKKNKKDKEITSIMEVIFTQSRAMLQNEPFQEMIKPAHLVIQENENGLKKISGVCVEAHEHFIPFTNIHLLSLLAYFVVLKKGRLKQYLKLHKNYTEINEIYSFIKKSEKDRENLISQFVTILTYHWLCKEDDGHGGNIGFSIIRDAKGKISQLDLKIIDFDMSFYDIVYRDIRLARHSQLGWGDSKFKILTSMHDLLNPPGNLPGFWALEATDRWNCFKTGVLYTSNPGKTEEFDAECLKELLQDSSYEHIAKHAWELACHRFIRFPVTTLRDILSSLTPEKLKEKGIFLASEATTNIVHLLVSSLIETQEELKQKNTRLFGPPRRSIIILSSPHHVEAFEQEIKRLECLPETALTRKLHILRLCQSYISQIHDIEKLREVIRWWLLLDNSVIQEVRKTWALGRFLLTPWLYLLPHTSAKNLFFKSQTDTYTSINQILLERLCELEKGGCSVKHKDFEQLIKTKNLLHLYPRYYLPLGKRYKLRCLYTITSCFLYKPISSQSNAFFISTLILKSPELILLFLEESCRSIALKCRRLLAESAWQKTKIQTWALQLLFAFSCFNQHLLLLFNVLFVRPFTSPLTTAQDRKYFIFTRYGNKCGKAIYGISLIHSFLLYVAFSYFFTQFPIALLVVLSVMLFSIAYIEITSRYQTSQQNRVCKRNTINHYKIFYKPTAAEDLSNESPIIFIDLRKRAPVMQDGRLNNRIGVIS